MAKKRDAGDQLLINVSLPGGKRSMMEAIHCPAREGGLDSGDTSDLVLDCGGVVSFTNSFDFLGLVLHRELSGHHGADAHIKKAIRARPWNNRTCPSG